MTRQGLCPGRTKEQLREGCAAELDLITKTVIQTCVVKPNGELKMSKISLTFTAIWRWVASLLLKPRRLQLRLIAM